MPLEIVRNDITRMRVDAIVNAANTSLLGGGGVDGAIHAAAGPELLEECRRLHGCRTGEAKITHGYRLPCKYVIHTAGPIWQDGQHGEREMLISCYRNSLELAAQYQCETVAFPMISAGVYYYPKAEALQVAVDTITKFLLTHDMTVYIVVFTRKDFVVGGKLFRDIESYIDDVYAEEHYAEYPRSRCEDVRAEYLQQAKQYAKTSDVPRLNKDSVDELLQQADECFSAALLRVIDEKHMTDAECYKCANIDRRLFHKIKNNPNYKPSKQTVLAFAIALKLTLAETKDMLQKAGFALSRSNKADIVVEYCIQHECYDIYAINEILFAYDLPTLGN